MHHIGGQVASSQPDSSLYDYRMVYDKVHHDWMIRGVRMDRNTEECDQAYQELMRKWKTRLEIWSDGEKMTSRWIQILCGFLQVIATPSWILYQRNTSMSTTPT